MQQELGEESANWMTCHQEYYLDFKLVHTIKGPGLCNLAANARYALEQDLSRWEQEIKMYNIKHAPHSTSIVPWYA